jgi:hypothetical protein
LTTKTNPLARNGTMLHEIFLRVSFEKPSLFSWIATWMNVAVASASELPLWETRFAAFMAGVSAIAATVYTIIRCYKEWNKK